jgi:hypothetical protein
MVATYDSPTISQLLQTSQNLRKTNLFYKDPKFGLASVTIRNNTLTGFFEACETEEPLKTETIVVDEDVATEDEKELISLFKSEGLKLISLEIVEDVV